MIGFELTEEQEQIRESARRFAKEVIRPVAGRYDEEEHYPLEEIKKAWELGLSTAHIPEELGGQGLSLLDQTFIDEELSWGCKGFWTCIVLGNALGLTPILGFGTDEQKKRFVTPFCRKFRLACYALTEPSGGSDIASIRTTARRDGDDYIINGSKHFITNGGHADIAIVFAGVNDGGRKSRITAFVVETDTPGFSVGKAENKLGSRCADTRQLHFDDMRVPAANRLGEEGQGIKIAAYTLMRGRTKMGAAATGIARAAMEHAAGYAVERKVGGKPIASHQAIQIMLADMAKEVSAGRLLTWQAATLIDQGKHAAKQASMAKCFASDAAMRIAVDAVQVYGGYGYCKDYPVEKLLRDAKGCQIGEGTNQIQRLVIAGELVREIITGRSR